MDLSLHICTREDIPRVHSFSQRVFDAQSTPNEHPTLEDWYKRYDDRKGIVIIAVKDTGNMESLGNIGSFLFAYESPSVILDHSCLHIWLCATDLSYRGKGLMRQLFDFISQEALQNRNLNTLSINTYPIYFPSMYKLLSKKDLGFQCVLTKDRSGDRGNNTGPVEQACFEKALNADKENNSTVSDRSTEGFAT